MNLRETAAFGVLVSDTRGTILCATGFACDPDIQKKLLQGLAKKRQQGTGLVALEGDLRLLAIWRATDDAVVFFIHSASSEPTLFDFVSSVDFAHAIFNYFVNSPYESMVVVDDQARLKFVPPVHAAFFGIKPGEGIGKHVTEVIENTKLHEVVRSGKAEIGKLQEMGGVTRVVARVPIIENGKVLGAIGTRHVQGAGNRPRTEQRSDQAALRSRVLSTRVVRFETPLIRPGTDGRQERGDPAVEGGYRQGGAARTCRC